MAKVHKSLRVDAGIAERVKALGGEGESEAATYNRVLSAGVEALEAGGEAEEVPQERPQDDGLAEALREHISTLRDDNEALRGQLAIKDEQIRALSVLTAQAQELHAATATKAIEQPKGADEAPEDGTQEEEKRRGFWARLFG